MLKLGAALHLLPPNGSQPERPARAGDRAAAPEGQR